jgi:hypothetical protein
MSRMVESVLRFCVPKALRHRAWACIRDIEWHRRKAEAQAIPYHDLEHRHLEHARLLANRSELLTRMPQGGVVAEIGVDEGEFSAQILAATRPATLHLIDLWVARATTRESNCGWRSGLARRSPLAG